MLKKLLRAKVTWIGLAILILGIILNTSVSVYLMHKYGNTLPILEDIILDNLPYVPVMWLYDLFVILSVCIMVVYAYKKSPRSIPYYFLVFGIMQVVRGTFLALTPFGNPNYGAFGLFDGSAFRNGMYPSGHTAIAFLTVFFTKGNYRKMAWFSLGGLIITLLLAKGHYSIDIFSGLLFTYAVYKFSEKYFKKDFVLKTN